MYISHKLKNKCLKQLFLFPIYFYKRRLNDQPKQERELKSGSNGLFFFFVCAFFLFFFTSVGSHFGVILKNP